MAREVTVRWATGMKAEAAAGPHRSLPEAAGNCRISRALSVPVSLRLTLA